MTILPCAPIMLRWSRPLALERTRCPASVGAIRDHDGVTWLTLSWPGSLPEAAVVMVQRMSVDELKPFAVSVTYPAGAVARVPNVPRPFTPMSRYLLLRKISLPTI